MSNLVTRRRHLATPRVGTQGQRLALLARILLALTQGLPAAPIYAPPAALGTPRSQQCAIQVRRDYNNWVASDAVENYALRFTPQSFRKCTGWHVAITAFAAASFLVLEAVGATLLVQYGLIIAYWSIAAAWLPIFAAGVPIIILPHATGWTWTCSRAGRT